MLFNDRNPDGSYTRLRTYHYNTDEENAQIFAWHYDRVYEPGQAVRFNHSATPEIKDRIEELLVRRYGWTVELKRRRFVWMRKPKESHTHQ